MKKALPYLLLHLIILIYSLNSICSKIASSKQFMSWDWILFYGIVIVLLGIYAILWQQILKKINLNIAYANKAVTVIWGTIFGIAIFHETITWNNIVGGLIVLVGVVIMVIGGDKENE